MNRDKVWAVILREVANPEYDVKIMSTHYSFSEAQNEAARLNKSNLDPNIYYTVDTIDSEDIIINWEE